MTLVEISPVRQGIGQRIVEEGGVRRAVAVRGPQAQIYQPERHLSGGRSQVLHPVDGDLFEVGAQLLGEEDRRDLRGHRVDRLQHGLNRPRELNGCRSEPGIARV